MKTKYFLLAAVLSFAVAGCSNNNADPVNPDPGPTQTIKVTGVSLNTNALSLAPNATATLVATIIPEDATNKNVTWSSSKTNVAAVNNGVVTAGGVGTSVITVRTVDGNFTDKCTVTVSQSSYVPVEDITLNKESINIVKNNSEQLIATIIPSTATNKNVTWTSNDTSVATVSNTGLVTGVSSGSTYITATAQDNDYFVECTVNVYDSAPVVVHPTSVHLNNTNLELTIGESDTLVATVLPNNANDKSVTFTSNNSAVSVDNNGKITANSVGSATITVKTNDGNFTDTCLVTVSATPVVKEARMQDTPILHCWNWSANNIKSHLDEIKEAGYKAIQLSPFQVHKSVNTSNGYWRDEWWKLYQPLGFKVSESYSQNELGTKIELTELCAAAEEIGIDVIMDVVLNHLSDGGGARLDSNIAPYEPTILNQNMIHTLNVKVDDGDPQKVVQGTVGTLPDLQTETEHVQSRAISLLKEYIDCGIDGFRFDAAKHIETPDDDFGEGKNYSSNFWPNVLNTTTNYAVNKGEEEPYYYGEILGTCGVGRKYSSYTPYMSVLDNKQSENIRNGAVEKNINYITDEYRTGVKPSKLVIWAESHDTYANDERETTDMDIRDIHKTYVMQTSRKDAAILYFARPGDARMGQIGTTYYKDPEIVAINKFHNTFVNQNENISIDEGCFINVRGNLGAAIVAIENNNSTVTLDVTSLENGNYIDLVNNSNYVVNNGQVTVNLTNGIAVLQNKDKVISKNPELTVNSYNKVYSGSQSISFTTKNATSVTYSINNGNEQTTSSNSITLPSSLSNGEVSLKITASNSYGKVKKSLSLFKAPSSLINKDIIIYDVPSIDNEIYCWAWQGETQGHWYSFTKDGNMLGLDMGSNNNFIVVLFPKGTTSPDWSTATKQSKNISFDKKLYHYSEFNL